MTQGGSNVVVELVNSARSIGTTVRDNADGSHHVQFDATAIGSYVPRVTVDGLAIAIGTRVNAASDVDAPIGLRSVLDLH